PRDIQVGVTVVAVTTFILAGIGNSLVIYIVCTVNQMKSSTNTLIANMAVADLLMTIDIPYMLKWVYVWNGWFGTFMGTALCKFFHSAQVGSLAASVFSLVAISLDRSFGILFPMRTIMTRNVVRFAIAAIWLGALALSIPLMLVVKNTKDERTGNMICDEIWPPISHKTYAGFLFTTSYIIPILIIAVVYFLAGMRLWSRKLPGHRTLMSHKKAQASSRRATVMLITVVIVFALSWFPFQALEIIRYIDPKILTNFTVPMAVWFVIPWFGYCNSAVNPIIYVIFSENYRHEFYRILCRGPSRKERYRKTIVYSRSATRTTRLSRASSMAVTSDALHNFKDAIPRFSDHHRFKLPIPRGIQIVVTVMAVTAFLLATIGNSLVIYIVYTVNHMKNSTNILIANMAVADLLMSIDLPYILKFFFIWSGWFGTFMGAALCKFFHSAQVGSLIASVFSLIAVSLDRSFAILYPLETIMTTKVVGFAIVIIWLGALAFMIPVMFVATAKREEETKTVICIEDWSALSREIYTLILFVISYAIPLFAITVAYFLAALRLCRRKLPGHQNPIAHKKVQKTSRRATVMLVTVVVVFALSWLPFQVLEMIATYNFKFFLEIPIQVIFVLPWFGYYNSAINPILYVIFSGNYRREFYRILCKRESRKERSRVAATG
ncbi:unnamed protein product, partial [Pocillopora meandrina]